MKNGRSLTWRTLLPVFVVSLVLLTIFRISSAALPDNYQPAQQEVLRLESRMTQLEQRLYAVENNIRNLDQQSRLGSVTSRGAASDDLVSVRLEIQTLQQRLAEYDCALAKLDERTLTREMREARRKSSGATGDDPCRLNVETPLRFSNRR
jgi:hypothetical protein